MAAIEKRLASDGSTSYRVKIRLRGHPVQSATFASLAKAKQWAQATESAIREGRYFQTAEGKKHTLAEAIERYESEKLGTMRAKESRKQNLAYWRAELGTLPLADVTPAIIKERLARLADEPSQRTGKLRGASTLNHYRQALASVMTEAVKSWEWLESSPMVKVGKKTEPRGRVRYLSDDERERLLTACKESSNPDLYPAVLLALTTGGRQAETMGATWRQIDLSRATLQLEETKNGSRRALHLAGPVLELLKERGKVRRIDTGLVFPSKVNPTRPVDLRQPWERRCKLLILKTFTGTTCGIRSHQWPP